MFTSVFSRNAKYLLKLFLSGKSSTSKPFNAVRTAAKRMINKSNCPLSKNKVPTSQQNYERFKTAAKAAKTALKLHKDAAKCHPPLHKFVVQVWHVDLTTAVCIVQLHGS